jgi:hypothetical protein
MYIKCLTTLNQYMYVCLRERISFSSMVCQGKTCIVSSIIPCFYYCLDGKNYKLLLILQYVLSVKYVVWI